MYFVLILCKKSPRVVLLAEYSQRKDTFPSNFFYNGHFYLMIIYFIAMKEEIPRNIQSSTN